MSEPITYKTAGVDIDAATESLARIKTFARSTFGPSVLDGLGGFGSAFDLGPIIKEFDEPVLVQSADGVGTKLMVASMTGRYDSVGMDIVNHCCGDILCQGARPLTFLDYIAVEKMEPSRIEQLVEGMAIACASAGVALVGGETAELPGMYVKGEYDLAGVITGVVEKSKMLTGEHITAGDVILGLKSSGLHTNGYTLARKVFFETLGMKVDTFVEAFGRTLGEELLAPHRNYSKTVWPLLQTHDIKALAHLTGGGFIDNIPRILPRSVDACIDRHSWETPPVFTMIQNGGNVPDEEMYRAFNMGIGMVIIIGSDQADQLTRVLRDCGEETVKIGVIQAGSGKTIFA